MVSYLAQEYGRIHVRLAIDKPTFPPNQLALAAALVLMEDERIARALNLLGENADLFSADHDGLLDLIGEYFDNHVTEGML